MSNLRAETGAFVILGDSSEATVFRRPKDSHPIYNLIGRVAAQWSQIEHMLDSIIWQLAKLDEKTGASVTSQMLGSHARLASIEALCRSRGVSNDILKAIKCVSNELKGIQTKRNRILHDPWYVQDDTDEITQFKASPVGEWETGFVKVDEAYLTETLAQISRRIELVTHLHESITAAL